MKWITKIKGWFDKRFERRIVTRYFKNFDRKMKRLVKMYLNITKDENKWLANDSALRDLADKVHSYKEDLDFGIMVLDEFSLPFIFFNDHISVEEHYCKVTLPIKMRKCVLEDLKETIQSYYDTKEQEFKLIQWGTMDIEEEETTDEQTTQK